MATRPANPLGKQIPENLFSHIGRIEKALAIEIPAQWEEDDPPTYKDAEQPAAIGAILVDVMHRHLRNRAIGYLFREDMAKRDKITLGQASKVGGKLAYYSELEFMIEINWTAWRRLSPRQKVALIDHELCHFGIESTEKGEKLVLLSHDVEEFGAIVQRWGLWKRDLASFARITQQTDLFVESEQLASERDDAEKGARG